MKKVLLLVDPLNDFIDKNGSLYVKDGEQIIPYINGIMGDFEEVILIQDWHPYNHGSFAATNREPLYSIIDLNGISQVMWPNHCVQNTWGSEPHKDLNPYWNHVVQKGMNPKLDSYSAFYENDQKTKTGLTELLKSLNVTDVYVVGLAADYCIKFTTLDSIKDGFNTYLIKDAVRTVNLNKTDGEVALTEMEKAGVKII